MDNKLHLDGDKNIVEIKKIAYYNNNFRKEIFTGKYSQVTVMSILPSGEVGLELHDNLDQIFYVAFGVASVFSGESKNSVRFKGLACENSMIIIPANTYHNIINEQNVPLKLFSIYAPPKHPIGTVHKTKFESDLADN